MINKIDSIKHRYSNQIEEEKYLDEDCKFYDFGTIEVSENCLVDVSKTGIPQYDRMIQLNLTCDKSKSGVGCKVVMMSPKKYYSDCNEKIRQETMNPHPYVEKVLKDRDIIEYLKLVITKFNRTLPMAIINYAGKRQEGLHRMAALAELTSWDTLFPVLCIGHSSDLE